MIKRIKFIFLISSVPLFVFAQTEPPQFVTVDGRLYDSTNPTAPLLDANVAMRIQVLNPAKTCILYEEQQSVSTLANGYFNARVGSPTAGMDSLKRTGLDSGNAMSLVFQNQNLPIAGQTSGGLGCSYTPAPGESRYFRFIVTPSTTGVTSTLSPDMTIDSVPQSLVAETLQGFASDDFLQINANVTQAKADSLFGGSYAALTSLLSGTSSLYLQNTANGTVIPSRPSDPVAPSAGQIWYDSVTNELKYYDGTAVQALSSGTTDPTKLPLAGGTMAGAIIMGSNDITSVGHITQSAQRTFRFGGFTAAQETTLLTTPPMVLGQQGTTWYNTDTDKVMYWDGVAAQELLTSTSANGLVPHCNADESLEMSPGPTYVWSCVATTDSTKLALAGGALTGALTLNAQNQVRYADSDSSNYAAVQSPAVIGTNYVLTLPVDDGNPGQVLQTDGNGILSWFTIPTAPVTSVFGRTGVVVAATSDYDANQIDNTPAGNIAATDVQAALNELDTEKAITTRNIGTAANSGLAGGGDLSADRNLVVDITGTAAEATVAGADEILIWDVSGGALRKMTRTNFVLSETEVDAMVANNGFLSSEADTLSAVTGRGANTATNIVMDTQAQVRFSDSAGGEYAAIQAPAAIGANYVLTLPVDNGGVGEVLSTDGNGVLSWIAIPSAPVTTVFGRNGVVVAVAGDYDANQIDNTPAGNIAATDVQAALNELDTEKAIITRNINTGANSGLAGGGNLSADRNLTVDITGTTALGAAADNADEVLIYDASGTALRKVTRAQLNLSETEVDAMVANNGYAADADKVNRAGDTMTGALNLDNEQELRLSEADGSGANYVAIKSPTTLGANYTLTLPADDGTNGQVLSTDGNGVLSWIAAGTSITADSLNFTDLADALVLDASTDISATGTNALSITNSGTGNSFRVNDSAGDTTPFVIDASGDVGIGVATPARPLHIRSTNATLRVDRDGDTVGFQFHRFPSGDYTTALKGFLIGVTASGADNGQFVISDLHQAVTGAGDARFTIDSVGRVGIGTNSPGTVLDVAGAITSLPYGIATGETGQIILRELAAGGTQSATIRAPDALGASYALTLPVDDGTNGQVLSTDGNGVLSWIGAGVPAADSINFTELADALVLDASTDISATGTNVLSITNSGTGDSFRVNDSAGDSSPFVIDQSGNVAVGGTLAVGSNYANDLLHIHKTNGGILELPVRLSNNSDTLGTAIGIGFKVNNGGADQQYKGAIAFERTDTNGRGSLHFLTNSGNNPASAALTDSRMTIVSGGNVGIGTTVPSSRLDVNGTVTSTAFVSNPSGAATGQTGQLILRELAAGGTETATIRAPDALGASYALTLPIDDGNNGQVLSTNGSGVLSWIAPSASIAADSLNFTDLADALVLDASTDISATGTNELSITNSGTGSSFRVNDSAGDTSPFLIDNSGNVGIGTSTPSFPLHVGGGANGVLTDVAQFGSAGQNPGAESRIILGGGSLHRWGAISAYDGGVAGAGGLNFYTLTAASLTSKMVVTNLGNVGIGTTVPGTILDVAGAITSRPSGTGTGQTGQIIMRELAASGTETATIRAPDALGASYALTLPVDDGTNGQVLSTDGNGVLSWIAPGASIAADSLNFTDLADALVLDASTDISATGTNVLSITNSGTGDSFRVNDQAGDTTPFLIDTDGNVGIGSTTPTSKLDVAGQINISGGPSITGNPTATSIATGWKLGLYDNTYALGVANHTVAIKTRWLSLFSGNPANDATTSVKDTNANVAFNAADGSAFFGGNVGVGTTAASQRLEAASNSAGSLTFPIKVTNSSNQTSSAGILFQTDIGDSRGKGALVYSGDNTWNRGDFHFLQNTAATTANATLADSVFTIKNSGFVGVGTTIPGTRFDVAGAITSRPSGTGTGQTGQLILRELAAGGSETATIRAPDALAASYALTLPADDGTNGQVLSTDGNGVLSWIAAGSSIAADSLNFTDLADALVLDASTDISATGTNVLSITNSGTGNSFIVNDEAADATPFVINNAGNVGIGVASPTSKLQVDGEIYAWGNLTSGNGILVVFPYDGNVYTPTSTSSEYPPGVSANLVQTADNVGAASTISLSTRRLTTGASAYISAVTPATGVTPALTFVQQTGATAYAERMRIHEDGNVGIGTTVPGTLLDVSGAITSRPSGTGTGQTGQIIMRELAAGGTETATIRAPDALGASYVLTLPVDDGTNGQVLSTNGSGVLSWVAAGASIAADSLNFTDLADALVLDASTDISATGTNALSITNSGTGASFRVNDAAGDTSPFIILDSGFVGIGTNNPTRYFQVDPPPAAANTAGSDIYIAGQDSTGPGAATGGALYFETGKGAGGWPDGPVQFELGTGWYEILHGNLNSYTPGLEPETIIRQRNGWSVDNNSLLTRWEIYNGSGNVQYAYMGPITTTGAGAYTPSFVFGHTSGNSVWTETMRINENGRLGVGTTVPGTLLDVAGAITSRPSGTGAGQTGQIIMRELAANGTNIAALRAPDTLGADYVLTLPVDDGTSGQVLSTDGNGVLSWIAAGGTPAADSLNFTELADALVLDASTDISATGTNVLSITNSGTGNSFRVNDAAGDTSPFVINNSGDVGIGTSSPSEKLSVVTSSAADDGVLSIQNTNAAAYSEFNFIDSSGTYRSSAGYGNASVGATHFQNRAFQWLNTGVDFVMGNSSAGLFTVQNAGNVGIGTTSPGTLLDVAGAITSRPFGTGAGQAGQLILRELAANGTNIATIRSPDALGANYVLTLPVDDGTSGQVLSTDGNGVLSWIAAGAPAADSINFTELADALVLDASTNISVTGANVFSISKTGTGDAFVVNTNTYSFRIDNDGFIHGDNAYLASVNMENLSAYSLSSNNGWNGSGYVIVDVGTGGANPIMNWIRNSTTQMILDSNGQLGVGTASPGTRLDVAGAITSRPSGTGTGQTGQIIMRELAANGTNTATIRSPDVLGANYVLTLPVDDGTSGQMLQTNGSGVLSWVDAPTSGGTFTAGAGSSGTPALTFSTDTDTGFYSSGSNDGFIGISSNGTTVASINPSWTTWRTTLGVSYANIWGIYFPSSTGGYDPIMSALIAENNTSQNDQAAGLAFKVRNTATTDQRAYVAAVSQSSGHAPALVFGTQTGATAYNERMRIDADGDLGIGTTNPSSKLNVFSSLTATSGATNRGSLIQVSTAPVGASTATTNAGQFYNNFAGDTNSPSATVRGIYATADNNSSRNVGSLSAFHGEATNNGASTISSANAFNAFIDNTNAGGTISNARGIYISGSRTAGTITNAYGLYIDSMISNTSKWGVYQADSTMQNYFAGNVGIGSTVPSRRLDVVDSQATGTIARFENTSSAADALGIEIETGPNSNPTNATDFIVFKDGDGTIIGQIEGGGGANVAYTTTSDRRLKENIRDTRYGIDQILKIKVRDYNYKQSPKQMTGFIAQELYEVYPGAVSRPANEEKESWGVDYSQMTPILVKGVQELHGICKMEQVQREQILARIKAQEQVSLQHGRDIASLKADKLTQEQKILKLQKENEQNKLRAERAEKENAEIKKRLEKIEKLLNVK